MATSKSGSARSSGTRKPTASAAQKRLSSERAAAARERLAQAQRRRRLMIVGGAVVGVVVVVAALIVAKVVLGGPKSGQKRTDASQTVLQQVASVPTATTNAVGAGSIKTPPSKISAPALTSGGKPAVYYFGAEYCPYCAAERWSMAVALSRFGTLSGVGETASSPSDVFPSTQTLSFHGSSFTSSSITFAANELQSNQVVNGQYATLDTPSAAEQKILTTYNAAPYVPKSSAGAIPFVDIGGRYLISGASYDPQVLQGKSHAQIAAALSDPNSAIAKAVVGTANVITAAICSTTSQQPSAVCSLSGVKAGAGKLAS